MLQTYNSFIITAKQALSTIVRGRMLGILLDRLVIDNKVEADQIHVIGFGLGAHLGRVAGNFFSQLNRNDNASNYEYPRILHIGRLTGMTKVLE